MEYTEGIPPLLHLAADQSEESIIERYLLFTGSHIQSERVADHLLTHHLHFAGPVQEGPQFIQSLSLAP